MGEALRIEGDLGAGPHQVSLFLHHREQRLPGQVDGDTLGLLHDDADGLQRVDDVDVIAQDVLVQTVLVDGVGQMYRRLLITAAYENESVLDAQVGVVADTGDDEDVAAAVVGVEVGPVIEVAVGVARPGDRLGDLVQRVFVKWANHFSSPPSVGVAGPRDRTATRHPPVFPSHRNARGARRCA